MKGILGDTRRYISVKQAHFYMLSVIDRMRRECGIKWIRQYIKVLQDDVDEAGLDRLAPLNIECNL